MVRLAPACSKSVEDKPSKEILSEERVPEGILSRKGVDKDTFVWDLSPEKIDAWSESDVIAAEKSTLKECQEAQIKCDGILIQHVHVDHLI